MDGVVLIGGSLFSFLFRIFFSGTVLSGGCFLSYACQQLVVPVLAGSFRLFPHEPGVILFVQTEKIPQPIPEIPVLSVHQAFLFLYVIRMAQPA